MPSKESIHAHLSFHQSIKTLISATIKFHLGNCNGLQAFLNHEIRLALPSWLIKLFLHLNTYSDLITLDQCPLSLLLMDDQPTKRETERKKSNHI
jgi:hypothetical protein